MRWAALRGTVERASPLLSCAVIVTVATAITATGPADLLLTMTLGLINFVLVIGLYVFTGQSGIFSFGQMAFMGIGAYTAGLLRIPADAKHLLLPGLPNWLANLHTAGLPAVLAAGMIACIASLLIALPLMRLSGLAASIATLAVLLMFNTIGTNWYSVLGGSSGMTGVPITVGPEQALIWALLALLLAFIYQTSRAGLRLRAAREDEVAARATGVRVYRERVVGFALSGFITGIAGGLFAEHFGSFSPDQFYLSQTFIIVAMLVVGGMSSLAGATAGAVTFSVLAELLRRVEGATSLTDLQQVGLAAALLLMLILRPQGLMGGRELTLRLRAPWRGRDTLPEAPTNDRKRVSKGADDYAA